MGQLTNEQLAAIGEAVAAALEETTKVVLRWTSEEEVLDDVLMLVEGAAIEGYLMAKSMS